MRLLLTMATIAVAGLLGWAGAGRAQTELVVAGYGGSFETVRGR